MLKPNQESDVLPTVQWECRLALILAHKHTHNDAADTHTDGETFDVLRPISICRTVGYQIVILSEQIHITRFSGFELAPKFNWFIIFII